MENNNIESQEGVLQERKIEDVHSFDELYDYLKALAENPTDAESLIEDIELIRKTDVRKGEFKKFTSFTEHRITEISPEILQEKVVELLEQEK